MIAGLSWKAVVQRWRAQAKRTAKMVPVSMSTQLTLTSESLTKKDHSSESTPPTPTSRKRVIADTLQVRLCGTLFMPVKAVPCVFWLYSYQERRRVAHMMQAIIRRIRIRNLWDNTLGWKAYNKKYSIQDATKRCVLFLKCPKFNFWLARALPTPHWGGLQCSQPVYCDMREKGRGRLRKGMALRERLKERGIEG